MPGAEKRPAPASAAAAAAAPKKKAKKAKKKATNSEPAAAADPAAAAAAAAAELDDLFGDLSRGKKAAATAAAEEAKAAKAAKAKAKERRKEEAIREAGSAVFTSDAHPNHGLNEEGKLSTEHGYHEDPNVNRCCQPPATGQQPPAASR